jgi:hypothetical protein
MSNCKFVLVPDLDTSRLLTPAPLPRSMILSQLPIVPVKRATATIVRPPFVAIFNVRTPASRYCDLVRLKVTWPMPCGPPSALYTGRIADPTEALPRLDTDANEGPAATRAKNLAQMELEFRRGTQFVGQPLQLAGPVEALYLPATHAVHGPPSGPE